MQPRRIALLLAYHGGGFHGFQRQPGFATVQGEVEDAFCAVTGESVTVIGSGRTDAGVHAWGQVAHLDTWSRLPAARLGHALNAYLPDPIVVRQAVDSDASFHANGSAVGKRYGYRLAVAETRPVLHRGLMAWERRADLDLAAMRSGARHLLGRHDFSAFAAAGRTTTNDVRTLQAVHIQRRRGGLVFAFQGDGFLYKMVRNLVGSLIEVGRGRWGPPWIASVLQSRERSRAAATAPPEGLVLWRVLYPKPLFTPVRGHSAGLD